MVIKVSNSLITGFHHISMKCSKNEIDEVLYFYRDILELDVCNEWDTGIMIDEVWDVDINNYLMKRVGY